MPAISLPDRTHRLTLGYVRVQWSYTGESFNVLQDTEFANPRSRNLPIRNFADIYEPAARVRHPLLEMMGRLKEATM